MKPQDFIHELNRMCTYYEGQCEENHCELDDIGCYINGDNKGEDFAKMYDTVAAWSDAHPERTRQSEFLKIFPNTKLDKDGVLLVFPCRVFQFEDICKKGHDCQNCRKEFWFKPVDEPIDESENSHE